MHSTISPVARQLPKKLFENLIFKKHPHHRERNPNAKSNGAGSSGVTRSMLLFGVVCVVNAGVSIAFI